MKLFSVHMGIGNELILRMLIINGSLFSVSRDRQGCMATSGGTVAIQPCCGQCQIFSNPAMSEKLIYRSSYIFTLIVE